MKKLIVLVLIGVIVVPAVLVVVGMKQERESLRYVETLQRERDVLFERFADPDNGAHLYLEAFDLFQEAPSKTVEQQLSAIREDGWNDPDPGVSTWIKENVPALERIREGNTKPFRLMPRMQLLGDPTPPILTSRWLALMLVVMGKRAEAEGDINRALHRYVDVVYFANGYQSNLTLIGVMLGTALGDLSYNALWEVTAKVNDAALLRKVLEELERAEQDAVPLSEAMITELLFVTNVVSRMYKTFETAEPKTIQLSQEEMSFLGEESVDLDQWVKSGVRSKNALWRWYLGPERVGGYMARAYRDVIEMTRLPYPDAVDHWSRIRWRIEPTEGALLNMLLSIDNPIAKILTSISVPNILRAHKHYTVGQAKARATRLILALQLFKLEHGQFPAGLSELVSVIDAPPPTDPFSEEPFRYRRTTSGYVLYSVGPDMTDDGGKVKYEGGDEPGTDVLFNQST